jgi:WD40 repeat protein
VNFDDLIDERTRSFTGRGWVFDRIADWYAGTERTLLITGKPGTGKTAVAARVAQALFGTSAEPRLTVRVRPARVIVHFCRAGNDVTLDPLRFVEALAQGLGIDLQEELLRPHNVNVTSVVNVGAVASGGQVTGTRITLSGISARQAFDRLIRRPMEALAAKGRAEPVLVLVDSLDEALTYGPDNIAALVADLVQPEQSSPLRFLLTSRPDARAIGRIPGRRLDLVEDSTDRAEDVRDFAVAALAPAYGELAARIADTIAKASDGNFLYARHAVADVVASDGDPTAVDLPQDLDHTYERFLTRELARDPLVWAERFRPILGLLAVAQAPGLSPKTIADAAGLKPSVVDAALAACRQFLDGPEGVGPFQLYHQSFRDFLCANAEYHVNVGEAHATLGESLVREHAGRWAACTEAGEYALLHGITPHLTRALTDPQTSRALAEKLADLVAAQVIDYDFLAAFVARGHVFQLVDVLAHAGRALPSDHRWRRIAELLAELVRSEAHFIQRRPQTLFQSLWNRGWWYDAPAVADFYDLTDSCRPSWTVPGERLHTLLERWRAARPPSPWLRALRPMPDPLGSPLRMVFPAARGYPYLVATARGGNVLLVGSTLLLSGFVTAYDLECNGCVLGVHASEGFATALVATGNDLAALGVRGQVTLLDVRTMQELGRISGPSDHGDTMVSLSFSADGRLLAYGNSRGAIRLWDMEDPASPILIASADLDAPITNLALAPAGDTLAVVLAERLWVGRVIEAVIRPIPIELTENVRRVACAPDGASFACTLAGGDVITMGWEGTELRRWRLPPRVRREVAFSPDSQQILVGEQHAVADVCCWDVSGEMKWRLPAHSDDVRGIAVAPTGTSFITVGDNAARTWDLPQLAANQFLRFKDAGMTHSAMSRNGAMIATVGSAGVIRLRRVVDGVFAHEWLTPRAVHALAISPDATCLGVGYDDGLVELCDIRTGARTSIEATAHGEPIIDLAFTADASFVAAASRYSASLVAVADMTASALPTTRPREIRRVVLSDDGTLVLLCTRDAGLVWDRTANLYRGSGGVRWGDRHMPSHACFTADNQFVVGDHAGELVAWGLDGDRVPVEPRHRQALDHHLMRGDARGRWTSSLNEMSLQDATGSELAWLPIGGTVQYHPSGRIWAIDAGNLHVYALEDA